MWWAVAAGGFIYYLLGAAWFTPLFGRAWDRSVGHDRSPAGSRFPLSYYIVPLIGSLVTTAVIAVLAQATSSTGAGPGTAIGAGVGLAIAVASVTNSVTPQAPHPYLLGAITGGYHLTGCTLAGLIVGLLNQQPGT